MDNLDKVMHKFKFASRNLYNDCFAVDTTGELDIREHNDANERFGDLECVLFQKLVAEPFSLPNFRYGTAPYQEIRISSKGGKASMMLNRTGSSPYWDGPAKFFDAKDHLVFMSFFDWIQLAYKDNAYVLAQVISHAEFPEAAGKRALIESWQVEFQLDSDF